MTHILEQIFANAFHLPQAVKTIATTDQHGVPHVEENNSIHVDADGRLVLLELNEYSRTNRNLVHSIWFDKKVTVHVRADAERQFQVIGRPYKALISGPRFETYYRQVLEQQAAVTLSTVWLIDPETVSDENPAARRARDAQGRQPLVHLDRIARLQKPASRP